MYPRLHTSLVLIALKIHLSNSQTTTEPPLADESGNADAFIGYTFQEAFSEFRPWYCNSGDVWKTFGEYGRCCPSGDVNCLVATACQSTSELVGPSSEQIETCTGTASQTVCVTGTIVESEGVTRTVMNYDCWPSWSAGNWDATRTTSAQSVKSSTPPPASGTQSTSDPPGPATTAEDPPGPNTSSTGGKSSLPKGAIVGIVVGLVAVIATALAVIFVYKRRRPNGPKGSKHSLFPQVWTRSPPQSAMDELRRGGRTSVVTAEAMSNLAESQSTPSELDATKRVGELDGAGLGTRRESEIGPRN